MARLIDKFGAFVGLFVLVMLLVIWGSQEPGQAQNSTSSKMAVTSTNDGYSEIYMGADAGSGSVNLMNPSAFDPFPVWQPNESEK
ncbi:hypothetical protein [Microcoleus sp. FACHB-672]|uniref:hypothetical protein n=1 Tax=Microcoleus sp. FACHB-672 TaxID=2692825 RepID=UPI00168436A1|nr:hypothetical protein [Microcoleus sp. FACHB-672]MBD2043277.1 hypothetical protein [Microcoleus sp. FACHB-672]